MTKSFRGFINRTIQGFTSCGENEDVVIYQKHSFHPLIYIVEYQCHVLLLSVYLHLTPDLPDSNEC